MTKKNSITRSQLTKLQTLYSKLAARELTDAIAPADLRAARIAWACASVGRKISSFADLSLNEAGRCISQLNVLLGIPDRRPARQRAHDAGTEGRRKHTASTTLVSGEDLDRIERAITRLGWNRAQFDAWLSGPASPLKSQTKLIRTRGDANRVWWAMKPMLKRAGLWNEEVPA